MIVMTTTEKPPSQAARLVAKVIIVESPLKTKIQGGLCEARL